jgi:hypothetical protein
LEKIKKEACVITLLSVWPCVCASSPPESWKVEPEETVDARQRLSKHVPAAANTTVEELLDAVFLVQSVLYKIIYS